MDRHAPAAVSFGQALAYWLRLGLISFGGPAGQIAIMHRELVEERRWISERRFLHALNYCMLLPGPEAQQLATYIGWLMHRTWGGVVAGALFVLPSLVILIVLAWIYVRYGNLPVIAGLLYGVKPAVTAIVLFAAWRIGSRVLRHPLLWGMALLAFVAIFAFRVPFPAIVLAAGIVGWLGARLVPRAFDGHAPGVAAQAAPALIGDDAPHAPSARTAWLTLVRVAMVFTLLWSATFGVLVVLQGWDATLTQMAWFFSKAALLTFGGAYAVLPYVFQAAVEHYGWLTTSQMIDGLALGEATPGPLLMVVTFIGFMGAWNTELTAAGSLLGGAMLAAVVATFFTFLPSFMFVLAGAPLIEATHGQLHFTAPLTGITAAVVGVIVNLAMFFAMYVWWPQNLGGRTDWIAVALSVAAFAALARFRVGVVPVIVVAALAGWLIRSA